MTLLAVIYWNLHQYVHFVSYHNFMNIMYFALVNHLSWNLLTQVPNNAAILLLPCTYPANGAEEYKQWWQRRRYWIVLRLRISSIKLIKLTVFNILCVKMYCSGKRNISAIIEWWSLVVNTPYKCNLTRSRENSGQMGLSEVIDTCYCFSPWISGRTDRDRSKSTMWTICQLWNVEASLLTWYATSWME